MTALYKPVPIESAEQATQMPDGSMAYRDTLDAYGKPCRNVAGKHRGAWWSDDREIPVAGWTALVPIEAEEETARDISPEVGAYGPDDEIPEHYLGPPRTRYTTPWEEA